MAEIYTQISKERTKEIAEDFMRKYNPAKWDGKGRKPKSFNDKNFERYLLGDGTNEKDFLDLWFEKIEAWNTGEMVWWTRIDYCEESDSIESINSVEKLAEEIIDFVGAGKSFEY